MLHLTKLLTACAAGAIGFAPAQAAVIALGKNTTLDPDFETDQLYPFLAVEGRYKGLNLQQSAPERLSLPGAEAGIGILRSATVTLSSRQGVTSGMLIGSMNGTGYRGIWDQVSTGESTLALNGSEIAFGRVSAPSFCPSFPNLSYGPCLVTQRQERAFDAVLALDPALATSAPLAFTLNLAQITSWDWYVLFNNQSDPAVVANLINSFSWSGTLSVSYAYETSSAAVPEPGTWLTLMSGFGVIGIALRRRRTLRVSRRARAG